MHTFSSMSRLSLLVLLGSGSGALLASCGDDPSAISYGLPVTDFDQTVYGPTDAPRPTDRSSFEDAMPVELPEGTNAHLRISDWGTTDARFLFHVSPDLNTPGGGDDPVLARVEMMISGTAPGAGLMGLGFSESPAWWKAFFTSGTVSMGADGTGTSVGYLLGNAQVTRLLLRIDRIEADRPLLRLSFGLANAEYDDPNAVDGAAGTPTTTAWATIEGVPSVDCGVLPDPDTHVPGDGATLVGDPQFQTAFCRGAVEAAGLSAFLP